MNLAHVIDDHPADAVAIISRGKPTTYGRLREQVAALRGGLAGLGVEPGDRIGILCANNRYFVISYLAGLSLGCVVVPLNPLSPSIELEHELRAVAPRAVVVGPSARPTFTGVDRSAVPSVEHVITPEGGHDIEGAIRLEDLLPSEPVPVVERDPSDVAVLVFTAGTAGYPKAAMLTHGNLLANLEQIQQLPGRRTVPGDVALGALPLFHIYGLNVVLGVALHAGSSVVLVERFDPATALDTIRNHGCTLVPGAPPMWMAWATMPGVPADAFGTVRIAASGASPLPVETAQAMLDRFGVRVMEGYGLTEASPVVTSSAVDGVFLPGSIGSPLPGVEIKLMDGDEPALLGDAGEIWVRGPNVFPGYWEDPAATAEALTPDGWLRTGDLAVADEAGHLTIVDRMKDLIIVSGFNVFPAEVEHALLEHPEITAVAVVGVPNPYSGESVKAYVVTDGHHLEEEEVIEFCATRIARYKCPTKVLFVDELPTGVSGKVLRRELRV